MVKDGMSNRMAELGHMSVDCRRVEKVLSVMQTLASTGNGLVRVGAIADALRDANAPTPAWQLRADCSALAEEGRISLHAESGAWLVVTQRRAEGVTQMRTALDTSGLPVITKPGRICILQSKWHFNLVQSMTEACTRVLAQAGYTKIDVHPSRIA